MLKPFYTSKAVNDINQFHQYFLSRNDLEVAEVMYQRIQKQVNFLCDHPFSAPEKKFSGVRESVVKNTPYKIFYRVEHKALTVLRVHHTAQKDFIQRDL